MLLNTYLRKGGSTLELLIAQDQEHEAVVPVRWCINKQEREYLVDRGEENAFILLIFAQKQKREHLWADNTVFEDYVWMEYKRELVPLSDMMRYVELSKSGKTRIFAAIVHHQYLDPDKEEKKKFRNYIADTSALAVDSVEDKITKEDYVMYDLIQLVSQTSIDVDVPAEFFAKEPSRWEKWWVNLWYENKPVDQCSFRRRRILAYTIQPFLVGAWVVSNTVLRLVLAIIFSVNGSRNVNWRAIVHPFNIDIKDVFYSASATSIFLKKKDGTEQPWYVRMLWPTPILVIVFVAYLVSMILRDNIFFWMFIYGIGYLAIKSISEEDGKLHKLINKAFSGDRAHDARKEKEKTKRKKIEQEYDALTCSLEDPRDLAPRLDALPKNKKTVRLRYQALKASVCKPFSK